MSRSCPVLFLIVFFLVPPLDAQSVHSEHKFETILNHLLSDQREIWTTPFREETWNKPQTFWFLGVSGASFTLDGDPSRSIRENREFQGFNDVWDSTPADLTIALLPLTLGLTGEWTGQDRLAELGWKSTEALAGSLIAVNVMKAASQRARPHTGNVYGFWDGGNSYPSGHAISAWAMAAVATQHYPEKKWLPWVAYPLAGLVSFSRVTAGHHFVSDVVAGSLLGFSIGRWAIE